MSDPLNTVLRRFVKLDEEATELERKAKAKRAESDAMEQVVWDHLDDAKQDYGIFDLGEPFGRVAFQKNETITATVHSASAAKQSLIEANLGDVMFDATGKLRKKPLNDEVRDWLRTGRRFLDGIGFYSKKYVTITRKPERKD